MQYELWRMLSVQQTRGAGHGTVHQVYVPTTMVALMTDDICVL